MSPMAVEALSKAARQRDGRIGFVREAPNPQYGQIPGAAPKIFVTDEVGQLEGSALFANFRTTSIVRGLSDRRAELQACIDGEAFTNRKARLLSIEFQRLQSDLSAAENLFSLVEPAMGPQNRRLLDLVRSRLEEGRIAA